MVYRFRKEISNINKSHINISNREVALRCELEEIENTIQKAGSDLIRKNFEKKYKDKYAELELVKAEKEDLTITEDELIDFLKEARKLVEHPMEILMNVSSFEQQVAVYRLFFEEFPTYQEILSGTPKLTLFFKLISELEKNNGQLVTLRRIELRFSH